MLNKSQQQQQQASTATREGGHMQAPCKYKCSETTLQARSQSNFYVRMLSKSQQQQQQQASTAAREGGHTQAPCCAGKQRYTHAAGANKVCMQQLEEASSASRQAQLRGWSYMRIAQRQVLKTQRYSYRFGLLKPSAACKHEVRIHTTPHHAACSISMRAFIQAGTI
jgi:hypothetical protein